MSHILPPENEGVNAPPRTTHIDETAPTLCVFCEIVTGAAPAKFIERSVDHVAFEPLAPQVPGHALFVPREHVRDATEDPSITAAVMEQAARYARYFDAANIITSVGEAATQSVFHLHIHVLPRGTADGLRPSWPWVRTRPGLSERPGSARGED